MSTSSDSAVPEPINLPALQASRLREIGAYLQQVRLEQNQTIYAITQETFIQAYQLKAIEAGDINALPQPIYVQGFINRTYAREQTSAGCKIPPAVATPLIKGGRGDPHAIGSASDLGCVSPN